MPFWEGGAKKLLLSLHRWREVRGGGLHGSRLDQVHGLRSARRWPLPAREHATCLMMRALSPSSRALAYHQQIRANREG
jgi:hypothetical protein